MAEIYAQRIILRNTSGDQQDRLFEYASIPNVKVIIATVLKDAEQLPGKST